MGHGRREQAARHRLAYEDAFGPIPEGLTIDHTCKVKRCVNPDHLEAVTQAENVRRTRRPDRCPQDHEYTPENTHIDKRHGGRSCVECRNERARAYKARRREGVR